MHGRARWHLSFRRPPFIIVGTLFATNNAEEVWHREGKRRRWTAPIISSRLSLALLWPITSFNLQLHLCPFYNKKGHNAASANSEIA